MRHQHRGQLEMYKIPKTGPKKSQNLQFLSKKSQDSVKFWHVLSLCSATQPISQILKKIVSVVLISLKKRKAFTYRLTQDCPNFFKRPKISCFYISMKWFPQVSQSNKSQDSTITPMIGFKNPKIFPNISCGKK